MAIVNGRSGTFNIYTQNQYINGYVAWQETYDDSNYLVTNKSTITINAYLHRTNIYSGSTYITNIAGQRIAYFGNEAVVDNSNITLSIAGNTSSSGGAYTHVFNASKEITHDNDGTKNIDIGFYMSNVETGAGANAFKVAKTMSNVTLTPIPRSASAYQSLNSKTETSISINWSSDSIIDYVWYSTDGGSTWKGIPGIPNATSGSYTLRSLSSQTINLTPNTSYNITTRLRRKDNGLVSTTSQLNVTTYDYPKPTSLAHFTIGDGVVVEVSNPLGRWYRVELISKETWAVISSQEGTYNGGVTLGKTENEINLQYMSIPDKQVGGYYARVLYNNNERTLDWGGTYKIRGNETPTVGSISYKDSNPTTTAITEDNQRIIRNNSNLLFTIGDATPKNYASISKYEIEFSGINKSRTSVGDLDFGAVNVANNLKATLKVTDSRGLSATKEIEVIVDNWILPTAITTLQRKNNFYSETYIKVDGSYSYLNGKNEITIKCQYKKIGDSEYSSLVTLDDNVQKTFDLDNNYQWNIRVIVTDKLGSTTYNLVLERGMPLIYFDRFLSSVGINCFPSDKNKIYENGLPISGETFSQMFTKGEKSVASGSLVTVDNWKTENNIAYGKFYCDPTNKRMVIPAGSAEYIEVSGNIAGYGSVYGYLSISDGSTGVDSVPFLISNNNYFSIPIASRIIKIPDPKKDYYVKLELQGYNGATFIINNGFGDGATYISVKKIL